ncbi:hypothetical protein SteCoe_17944 [Stentor coeruleus]|uniref:Calcium-dependent protein kinase 1 n=1 Tax=Stentor coeruleus TaxID=5963 RepID=A0A1R2BXK9_9CILI|nr:hypothetical protein SteCoe_17944 [Stentor coeruleus]
MGCSSSNTKPNTIIKSRRFNNQTQIDSPEKIAIRKGTFIFHKTWNITRDYELGPVLGQGAYGYVRTAVHKLTGQERAIKTVKKEKLTRDMQLHSKFFTEIDILRKIDHPNILRLFEFYEDSKGYHLVTEIIKGGELFEFIVSSGVLSESIAAHFMRQILGAVNYCHQHGIVHRDLKPENLLLEKRSSASILKIIDFGASTLFEGEGVMKIRYGTSYYIAPEVLKNSYNEKCDIWSCGVILYVLLSGRPPFSGKNDDEIMSKVKKGTYNMNSPEWENVSEAGKEFIKKMLQYNPELRYSADQALNDTWFIQSSSSTSLIPPSIINSMKTFHTTGKLQHAVLAFITSQLSSKDETSSLAETFKSIDKNGDGKLSREELLQEFKKTMREEEAEQEVQRILSLVDMDMNGYIDYSEFLMATMKKESLINKRNLETAFRIFDRDSDGSISASEIKSILGDDVESLDEVWKEIISKVDQDGDGMISIKEFKDMMMKIFESNS